MKRSHVVVPWKEGLHLRPAAKLVKTAQNFRSSLSLKYGDNIADLRSILSVVALCATMGTPLEIVASGEDEELAAQTMMEIFSAEAGEEFFMTS